MGRKPPKQEYTRASLVAQMVKNPPAIQETWLWSLGWDNPLEKGMDTHFSIFAWRITWTEEYGRLQSMGSQRVGHNWETNAHTWIADSLCCTAETDIEVQSCVRLKKKGMINNRKINHIVRSKYLQNIYLIKDLYWNLNVWIQRQKRKIKKKN